MKKLFIFTVIAMFLMTFWAGTISGNQEKAEKKEAKKCCTTIKCPVMGHEIKDPKTAPKTEYKGKTYYFCCEKCLKSFKENPEKYAHKCSEHCKKVCCGDKKKNEDQKEGQKEEKKEE